jgi:CspA family cold shock protein
MQPSLRGGIRLVSGGWILDMDGKVTWFNPQKGFGFIQRSDGVRVFFRSSDLEAPSGDVRKGDRVEFEAEEAHLVPRARRVTHIRPQGKAA